MLLIDSLGFGVQEILRLGGQVVQSVMDGCTHLVANAVLRTVKFLTAIGIVKHIVTSDWIMQSSAANQFLGK
jgi:PAX-interacting protein 1